MSILDQGSDGGIYLGDGVYCKFDGNQLWLTVGEHRNPRWWHWSPKFLRPSFGVAKQINQFSGQEYFSGVRFEGVRQT